MHGSFALILIYNKALSVFEISVTNLLGILFINLVENINDTAIKKAIFVTIEKFYTCTDQKIKLLHCKRKKYVFWWLLGVFMQRKNCSWNLYLKMSTHILLVRYLVFCQKSFCLEYENKTIFSLKTCLDS